MKRVIKSSTADLKYRRNINFKSSTDTVISSQIKSFRCPNCGNLALYSVEQDIHKVADVYYHEQFVCDECGAELLAEPQYDGSIKFVMTEDVDSATKAEKRSCKKCNSKANSSASSEVEASSSLCLKFKMVAEFEDGFETTVGGYDEGDCIATLDNLTEEHGAITWYSGYNEPLEGYFDGEYDPNYQEYDDYKFYVDSSTDVEGSYRYDEKRASIEELAMDGEVSLGRCSRSTLYRWAKEINERLEAQKYDWRVKAVPADNSLVAVPLSDVKSATDSEDAEDYISFV